MSENQKEWSNDRNYRQSGLILVYFVLWCENLRIAPTMFRIQMAFPYFQSKNHTFQFNNNQKAGPVSHLVVELMTTLKRRNWDILASRFQTFFLSEIGTNSSRF